MFFISESINLDRLRVEVNWQG